MDERSGSLGLGDAELWYAQRGQGPALTLLHAGICDSRSWGPQVDAFAERFETLRFDRRGFGLSRSGSADYFPHGDLLALLDHLGVATTHLVGCSQGGKVAIDFALAHPERVGSLVLVSSALAGYEHPDSDEAAWPEAARELAVVCNERPDDLEAINGLEIDLWVAGRGRTRKDLPASLIELCLDMNGIALRGAEPGALSPEPSASTRLAELELPTLVVTGDRDVPSTRGSCRAIATGVRGARLVELTDCAHLPNLEQPGEFNRLVLEFLSTIGR